MPFGHWTQTDGDNIIKSLEKIMEKKGLDPLLAESWYSFTTDDILAHKVLLEERKRERKGKWRGKEKGKER